MPGGDSCIIAQDKEAKHNSKCNPAKNWNTYLWPLIVLQTNETKTITLVIASLASGHYPDYGVVMVGTILATLPVLIVFFVMQRQFVQGMLGSIK